MKVAFLRGINVSGKNRIDMKKLKELLESIGLTHVKTYLNTGNVIYDGHITKEDMKLLIQENFDCSIEVVLKSLEELKNISDNYRLSDGLKNSYVTMFNQPVKDYEMVIEEKKHMEDSFEIFDDYLCLHTPNGYGKTKLTNGYFEKKLSRIATTRNVKTIRKVLQLMV